MLKSTDDLDTYRGTGRTVIAAPSGRHRAEPDPDAAYRAHRGEPRHRANR